MQSSMTAGVMLIGFPCEVVVALFVCQVVAVVNGLY